MAEAAAKGIKRERRPINQNAGGGGRGGAGAGRGGRGGAADTGAEAEK
jgi:hypothetical protein